MQTHICVTIIIEEEVMGLKWRRGVGRIEGGKGDVNTGLMYEFFQTVFTIKMLY